jgi:NADPH:quinone reductase-like Zn-dependent oxidoreductase
VKAIKGCPPVRLSVGSIGFLDTFHFTEDNDYAQPLDMDDAEIQVRALGLNLRDVLVALGRLPGSTYGSEAAGVVTRVGSSSLGLSPGDRVVMAGANFQTYARGKADVTIKLNDSMSFVEASSILTQFCTA